MMQGKTIIVTGANSGIGKATTIDLLKRHGRVIMACRDVKRAEDAARDIRMETDTGELVIQYLDLASLTSVHRFCENVTKVCYVVKA